MEMTKKNVNEKSRQKHRKSHIHSDIDKRHYVLAPMKNRDSPCSFIRKKTSSAFAIFFDPNFRNSSFTNPQNLAVQRNPFRSQSARCKSIFSTISA
jgi:hypothetical protein